MTKIERLELIKRADNAYYNEDNPIMEDAEYDKLRNEYVAEFGTVDLDYVPGDINSGFQPFTHEEPVASLGKVKQGEDSKLRAAIEKLWPVVIEPKLDGLTVVAYPDSKGKCTFVTRGNGSQGDTLPNFISWLEDDGVNMTGHPVRGEVFMNQTEFEIINNQLRAEGKLEFSNPRNAAAGILRNKERSRFINSLRYMVYDVLGVDLPETKKIDMIMNQTKFENIDCYMGFESVDKAMEDVSRIYDDIINLGFLPIDGMVIKTDQENSLEKYGRTGHHPNNAIAWKVAQEGVVTTIKDIEWQVGRKYITPVAIMEPVQFQGSVVEKASVANPGIISRLKLTKGAKVRLIKANEIIPQIVAVEEDMGGEEFKVPDKCPCCGTPVRNDNDRIYCPSKTCHEKLAQMLNYIGSKKILNIKGMSIKTARKIVRYLEGRKGAKLIPEEVYSVLEMSDFTKLAGFGEKSAENLAKAVEAANKNVPLPNFFAALAFEGIGITIGTLLAERYHNLNFYVMASMNENFKEELLKIDGIGEETANILDSEEFKFRIDVLCTHLEPMEYKSATKVENSGSVSGKNFVLTGKMNNPRSYYEEKIKAAGGNVQSSVSKNTDYLVIADTNSQSSKAKKARDLGTKLISPEELLGIIE